MEGKRIKIKKKAKEKEEEEEDTTYKDNDDLPFWCFDNTLVTEAD
jgi:hypothetical protein